MRRLIIIAICVLVVIGGGNAEAQNTRKGLFKSKKKELPSANDSIAGLPGLLQVMNLINNYYVTDPNTENLSEVAIKAMLKSLDPHSMYIPARNVQRTNEALKGNFEGVGITFMVLDDTICVQEVIAGGPSEKVGLMRGDKFLKIDGIVATGDSAKQDFVFRHLRGKKGTVVETEMLRGGDTLSFAITRDKIPIYSVEVAFMEPDSIGYIHLLRFAATSVNEFRQALNGLKNQGMKSLILDLRGNGGGYLEVASGMANEFLSTGKLIVYQEGRVRSRQDFRSNRYGSFRTGELVVLIDENSASASEIVSGAVQDWDRGTVIGRRSFGKGLVQTQFKLDDGSEVRITTARYYTPSGRCIQKPYGEGADEYDKDISARYKHGEMFTADSIHFPDSLKYTTAGGRTVYGGGGIMPDIFVPMDTTPSSKFYQQCRRKGIINQYPQHWADKHRDDTRVVDYETFLQNYDSLGIDALFVQYAAEKGVYKDSLDEKDDSLVVVFNDHFLHQQVKGLLADCLFGRGHYYQIMKEEDPVYRVAVNELRRKKD